MEERVSKLETEVINLDKRLCANERRLDIHGEEIDGINKVVGNLEKNMALLNLTVETVLDNTKEIKGDIKEIRKLREDDHINKPEMKRDKLIGYFLSGVIGFFLMAFLGFIFPYIANGGN